MRAHTGRGPGCESIAPGKQLYACHGEPHAPWRPGLICLIELHYPEGAVGLEHPAYLPEGLLRLTIGDEAMQHISEQDRLLARGGQGNLLRGVSLYHLAAATTRSSEGRPVDVKANSGDALLLGLGEVIPRSTADVQQRLAGSCEQADSLWYVDKLCGGSAAVLVMMYWHTQGGLSVIFMLCYHPRGYHKIYYGVLLA